MTDSADTETQKNENVRFGKRVEGELHFNFSSPATPRSGAGAFFHLLFQILMFPFRVIGFLYRCLVSMWKYLAIVAMVFVFLVLIFYVDGMGIFMAFAAILGLTH